MSYEGGKSAITSQVTSSRSALAEGGFALESPVTFDTDECRKAMLLSEIVLVVSGRFSDRIRAVFLPMTGVVRISTVAMVSNWIRKPGIPPTAFDGSLRWHPCKITRNSRCGFCRPPWFAGESLARHASSP